MPNGESVRLVCCGSGGAHRQLSPMRGTSMAAEGGVAGATGRAARRESRSLARPLRVDAVASPGTAPLALVTGGAPSAPRRGARRRGGGGERRRAPWQLTIKLVVKGQRRLGLGPGLPCRSLLACPLCPPEAPTLHLSACPPSNRGEEGLAVGAMGVWACYDRPGSRVSESDEPVGERVG